MKYTPYKRTLTRSQRDALRTVSYPPPAKLGGREPLGMQRSGPSVPSAGGAQATTSPSATGFSGTVVMEELLGGTIVDLSPAEWTRISKELSSSLSRSALRTLAQRIVALASRVMVPIRILQWALDIINLLATAVDTYVRREGPGWYAPGQTILAECSSPLGTEIVTVSANSGLPPGAWAFNYVNNCLAGQGWQTPISKPFSDKIDWAIWQAVYGTGSRVQDVLLTSFPRGSLTMPDDVPVYKAATSVLAHAPMPIAPPVPKVSQRPQSSSPWPAADKRGSSVPDRGVAVDDLVKTSLWVLTDRGGPPRKVIVDQKWWDARRLPGRKREKKVRIVVAGQARRVIDFVGEVPDFVECFWDNLPKSRRSSKFWKPGMKQPKKPTVGRQLVEIYNAFDAMDVGYLNKVFDCLVVNQIEDFAWGKLGQISGKAGAAMGRPVGIMTGPAL